MPDYDKLAMNGVTCPMTGKKVYMTRKDARAARNRLGNGLSIYSCAENGPKHFHIGHHGTKTRQEHRELPR